MSSIAKNFIKFLFKRQQQRRQAKCEWNKGKAKWKYTDTKINTSIYIYIYKYVGIYASMYIRDAQSSLLRTRCSRPVGATDSDSLPPFRAFAHWKPLPVRLGCTLAMFVPLRELRSSFEEKWNKFKYIFSAFRIKQKDASSVATSPANCQSSPVPSRHPRTLLLFHLRPSQASAAAAPAGLLVCKALGQPLYFPAVCRLGFCVAASAALPAPFIVVVLPTPAALPLPLSLFTYLLLRFIILH